ncbi:MAG: DUF4340 domain-containing protein [Desulfobacter sp.]|nr:MAG: DUF4340 domain-containing protein [Desulfobacter sp.]
MKKEYIILIALIIGLGAYLGLKKDDRVHYELPVPPVVDADKIDRLEIKKDKFTIVLNKGDKGWTLTEKKFPADKSAVDNMLDTVKGLKLSALVSEASDLIRYELDPPNAVQVKAFEGQDEKRAFTVGKTAPSFNHTFIMLAGDKRIFQADKSFRNYFDKSVDDLRDKLVFEIKTETIKKITMEKEGKSTTLTRVTQAEDKKKGDDRADIWQSGDGTEADLTAVSDLISSLSRLECSAFLPQGGAQGLGKETVLCKIMLENDQVLSLNLFKQDGKETMAGTASSTPYAFSLASYKADDIVSYVDKLLGIEKKEDSGSDKE